MGRSSIRDRATKERDLKQQIKYYANGEYPLDLERHPYSELMGDMDSDTYESTRQSILSNGIREPIIVYENISDPDLHNTVLDGWHRYRIWVENQERLEEWVETATDEHGNHYAERPEIVNVLLPVITRQLNAERALELVLDLNANRRHLTTSQRAYIADRLSAESTWGRESKVSLDTLPIGYASDRMSVSQISVKRMRFIRKCAENAKRDDAHYVAVNALPKIRAGDLAVTNAYENVKALVDRDKEREAIVEEGMEFDDGVEPEYSFHDLPPRVGYTTRVVSVKRR